MNEDEKESSEYGPSPLEQVAQLIMIDIEALRWLEERGLKVERVILDVKL